MHIKYNSSNANIQKIDILHITYNSSKHQHSENYRFAHFLKASQKVKILKIVLFNAQAEHQGGSAYKLLGLLIIYYYLFIN